MDFLFAMRIPAAEAGDMTVVEVRPDLEKMKELGVSQVALGKVLADTNTQGDDLDQLVIRLRDLPVPSDGIGSPAALGEISEIETVRQQRCILRRNALRVVPALSEE
jgi:hypothetical protein